MALALLESGQHSAQQRLVLEELLAHNLSVLKVRAQAQTQLARALKPAPALVEQLLGALPFTPPVPRTGWWRRSGICNRATP